MNTEKLGKGEDREEYKLTPESEWKFEGGHDVRKKLHICWRQYMQEIDAINIANVREVKQPMRIHVELLCKMK